MSNIAEQFIYDKKVWMVGDAPNTIRPTGKYPIIANQQWNTLEDMVNYINDPESSAIPGMILTVVNDGTNNGIYFIESVGEVNGESVKEATYSKVADSTNINDRIEQLVNDFNDHLVDRVEEHSEMIKGIQGEISDSKIYESKAQENWKTVKVGGVNENTSATEFIGDNKKTISEVLDDILFPTIQPTVTKPSVSVKCEESTLLEIGSIFPPKDKFTCTSNRGNVTYKNKDGDNFYAGVTQPDTESLVIEGGDVDFGDTVNTDTSYKVTYSINFDKGPELLDNKGQKSTVASYPGGSASASVNVDFVYPIWVTSDSDSDITGMKQLELKNYHTSNKIVYEVNIPEETVDKVFTIHIPPMFSYEIKKWNDVAGKYDDTLINMRQDGTFSHGSFEYNVYKKADTSLDGESKYEITIKK